ncbi:MULTISPECIES: NADP-dependent oxidoreductase [Streptomyces]|uniref:NADP-dependent oxidoreductase n=1 Tax=Streptomyces morookaense TaxID=1970 RepID=A0A7Y7E7L7_STRMO|nr:MULTISPECIES: NADP-dependent oxidoreductase [Streptomyces]MCC2276332.1 NADP-dependent oxidoreductase [Streptomyces sp. ET3-23]NVK78377.1 NADP-dependent oxidoreductase [Streptomyces morookaense]GHF49680.1 oxidoreductase [Streptomyces morookaense]
MKAVSYRSYGGPEVLEYGDLPQPKVGPDAVLVRVKAAAVNPVDWKAQAGYLDGMIQPVFPVVPGWDMAGVVVATGPDVPEFAEGDEVMGYVREDFLSRGTFAEYVAAPVRTLARKPANLTFEEAAGIPLAGLTAYQSLVKALRVRPGETVLIHAAAGGVGSMAVQIARHLGARVIGTAGARNHDYLHTLGAEPVTYGDGLADRVRALAPGGVDVVLDLVGGGVIRTSPELALPGARLVSIADPAVTELGGRLLWVRPDAADLAALADLAEAGALRVEVAQVFPLEKTAEAQRLSAEGHVRGKLVVTVG